MDTYGKRMKFDNFKFDITCKITIENSFEPVITWIEDNMNKIFCIGKFMSRFKDTLEECDIAVVNTKYDSSMDCIDYEINDRISIRVTLIDQLLFPKANSLYVLFLERFDTGCDFRSFVHSYYFIEFKKDEYIKCTDEWHRAPFNGSSLSPEEYLAIDEKLHIAVDRQIFDIDKEFKSKNTQKSSSIELR
ncbi:MAG: hypothetical protein IKU29_03940 [Parabacteroides sp.]|nr:hypothetical protein [Parabacteroides sp.]